MTVHTLQSVDSTNTFVLRHFAGLEDGDFVWAREQTAGRGRRGRPWLSPPGSALTGTFVWKEVQEPFHAGCLTGLAGLALLRRYAPSAFPYLKWPNDIYVREKKIAGILCEGNLAHGRLAGVAAGIGINLNQSREELERIDQPATSLRAECGEIFSAEKLAEELAKEANRYYIIYKSAPQRLLAEWRKENRLIGEQLELIAPDGTARNGVFAGLSGDGAMLVRSENGEMWCFHCGDVKINAAVIDFNKLETKIKSGMEKHEQH